MTEEWRQTRFPNYSVSSFGRVRNDKTGRVLNPSIDMYGYPQVSLYIDKQIRTFRVHRFVALAFLGEPPDGKPQVAHNDGNHCNNHVSNLRWASNRENMRDKQLHGRQTCGEKHYRAKLTDVAVAEIRKMHATGTTLAAIAGAYGINNMTVRAVVTRKTWKHVA